MAQRSLSSKAIQRHPRPSRYDRSLADAFNATNRFVEITVSNRPPIAPRQQILSAPFAFQAANSAKLGGYDWSAVFGTNDPVAGTVPSAKIAEGAITPSKLAMRATGTNVGIGGIAISLSTGTNFWNSPTPTVATAVTNLLATLPHAVVPFWSFLIVQAPHRIQILPPMLKLTEARLRVGSRL